MTNSVVEIPEVRVQLPECQVTLHLTITICTGVSKMVYVRIRDEEWNVFRRYSQFLDLHTRLKKVYPIVSKFEFPPKKSMGNKVRTRFAMHVYVIAHVLSVVAETSFYFGKEK